MTLLQGLLIIVTGLWIYSPVFHGYWLWDDDTEIYQNPITLDQNGWWVNWLMPSRLSTYYPIKADVQWLQWRIWGLDTPGYHLTNIGLHVISALLVWRLLSKLGLRLAWLGGMLFVVHPVTVESVAWISEIKNALSLPPFLLALCYWIEYDKNRHLRDYLWAAGWFLIAMLCKITMAFFPAIILLHAWWKHGRLYWRDLKVSMPFWAIGISLASITLWLQQSKRLINHYLDPLGGILQRLVCAQETVLFFLWKAVWPVELLPVYQPWPVKSGSIWQLFPSLILIGVLIWFWTRRRTWGRHVLLGVGFFLIMLIPVIGFIQLQYASMVWSLDHLNYLPLIGLIGLAVTGLEQISLRLSPVFRRFEFGMVAVMLVIMAWESHLYASAFSSPYRLWTYTLAKNPDAAPARTNLGLLLLEHHRIPEAIEELSAALKINPENSEAQNGLGNALFYSGKTAEAIPHYKESLKHNPNYTPAYNGLANALMQIGDLANARATCEKGLRIDPDYVGAHCTLGLILIKMGDADAANAELETAKRLDPAHAKTLQALETYILNQKPASK